jgi:hypothetical protein
MAFRDLITPARRFEREMRAAKDAGTPWFALVRTLDAALDAATDGDEAADLAEAAEAGTGLTHVMWKRYRAALTRTEAIARDSGLPPECLLSPAFAHQEIALRIHDRSAVRGLEILQSSAEGGLRLADLRERLSHMPSSDPTGSETARAAVVRAKSAKRNLMDRALKDSTVKLWGAGSRIVRRPRLRFMSTHGYEVIARDDTIAGGVDVADFGVRTNRDNLADAIAPALLTSTFFKSFFIACIATNSTGAAERSAEVLDWLGVAWVGVMAVRADGTIETVRPSSGPPVPDRSDRYEAAKRRFGTRSDEMSSAILEGASQ